MTTTSRWKHATLVCLACAAAASVLAFREHRQAEAQTESLGDRLAELEDRTSKELAKNKVRRASAAPLAKRADPEPELAAATPTAPAETTDSAEESPKEIPAPELSPEELEYRAGVYGAARLEAVEQAFEGEQLDAEWSEQATAQLRLSHAVEELSALSIESECRASICQVRFSYADPVTGLDQVQALKQHSPWPATTFQKFDTETMQGTLYLSREGFDLPRVDRTTLRY